MIPLDKAHGTHKVITLRVPGRQPSRLLCLAQRDGAGEEGYYVLAECEGSALRWRNRIKDNTARRLRDGFVRYISDESEVDLLDVEAIFFCTAEVSKA